MPIRFDFSKCPVAQRMLILEPIPKPKDKAKSLMGDVEDDEPRVHVEDGQQESEESAVNVEQSFIEVIPVSANNQQNKRKKTANDEVLQNTTTLLDGVDKKLGREIIATILSDTDETMDTVKGNEQAKQALRECVVLPSLYPHLYTGLRSPSKGILLFGPPGNGKTMLAKAVANQCQFKFFNISAAIIMSKWMGEAEKLVKALFTVAKNAQPSVIFIDEVDSMLSKRQESGENESSRRVKNEFLTELDGCTGKVNDRVLVLAATNRPFDLDEGFMRRFPKRIFIDLPDNEARAHMIRRTFADEDTREDLTDEQLNELADKTQFYSYCDLKALCRCAAQEPLRELDFNNINHMTPAELRAVNFADFQRALKAARPSTNEENRQKLLDFAEKYAEQT